MVDSTPRDWASVERRLILSYVRADARAAVAAVFALDDWLGAIALRTRDPMIAQMRLTWWHDALTRLDTAPPDAHPVLRALAGNVLPGGITGARLAGLVEGWEALLEPDTDGDDAMLIRFATDRGGALFSIAGDVLGATPGDRLAAAGKGWALAGVATAGVAPRARAAMLAAPYLAEVTAVRWSRNARALGALAHLAALPGDAGPARRTLRALAHRMTGR